ncbi:MAG: DUF370 domain-containing protein [Clostridiales bacterium]|jgi:regulator of extracellular matrix RemA (YlzA/DUF370 family)|nr:DUF370 domain-containing protein [Clostridiales bacterium]MCR5614950.1 DUF370 domain-containing protein [Saccharofermentans sp.]MBQ2606428.1 DUF370 domain-containing protein [Clostridiales bacterium]MBQ4190926.1 DUF370 domain-containing protein [Clostridiales bacterium]MBQ4191521.1 DUF370 domain-containing protein [Clostridiales bacterium]
MAEFIDIGFGNIAAKSRIVCAAGADSAPARRMIQESKDRGACVDCCAGKKCRTVLVTDTDLIIMSALEIAEIKERLDG